MRILFVLITASFLLSGCAPDAPTHPKGGGTETSSESGQGKIIEGLDALASAKLREKLANLLVSPIQHIRATPVPGLYEIQSGTKFAYISADGTYLIEGDMNNIETGARLTENRRKTNRIEYLANLGADSTIEFAPKGKPAKHTVTVFTDIDCGYCRKLHQHIDEYNDMGIAVRYLFFPRSGPDTESFFKAEQVWCAKDRQSALTAAKSGSGFKGDKSCDNPVMAHFKAAHELGARGTPAIILDDGSLLPGYQPPEKLLKRLEEEDSEATG